MANNIQSYWYLSIIPIGTTEKANTNHKIKSAMYFLENFRLYAAFRLIRVSFSFRFKIISVFWEIFSRFCKFTSDSTDSVIISFFVELFLFKTPVSINASSASILAFSGCALAHFSKFSTYFLNSLFLIIFPSSVLF